MTDQALSMSRTNEGGFRSIAAETGEPVGEAFAVHGLADVDIACAAAAAAFDTYRSTDRETRALFLERIGEEIMAIGDDLIVAAMRESGLPRARLEGERGRTVGQLKVFAGVVRAGCLIARRCRVPIYGCVWCRWVPSRCSARPISRSPSPRRAAILPLHWPQVARWL